MSSLRTSDNSILSKRQMKMAQLRVFDTSLLRKNLRNEFTKSCRDIVAMCKKSSNPRPGPIPAPTPLVEVIQKYRAKSARDKVIRQV